MGYSTLFFVFCLCVASVVSQTVDIQVQSGNIFVQRAFTVKVSVTSFGSASSLTGSVFPQPAVYSVQGPASFVFNTVGEQKTFTFSILASGATTLHFNFTDGTNYYNFDSTPTYALTRGFSFDTTSVNSVVKVQSNAVVVNLANFEAPDTGSVTLTLDVSSQGYITLSTNTLTFTPGVQSLTFYFTVTQYTSSPLYISGTVNDNVRFTAPASSFGINVLKRSFTIDGSSNTVYFNQQSSTLRASVNYLPPTGVSLQLSAPNTTFYPSTLSFSPTVGAVDFSYKSSYPGVYQVTLVTQGTDSGIYYDYAGSLYVQATVAPIYITYPASNPNLFVTQSTLPITITLAVPAVAGLTLTAVPSSTFSYSSNVITFAAGETTKTFFVSSSQATTATSGAITFTVSGSDAGLFENSLTTTNAGATSYTFNKIAVSVLNGENMFCGESATYTVSTNFPAVGGFSLALTLTSAGSSIITPSTLNFAAGETSKTFTVQNIYDSPTIAFVATGTDYPLLAPISPVTINLRRKNIQIGSVYPTDIYGGQSFGFPVSVDFVPTTDVTVTPMLNGVTFTPSSFTFTPTANTVYFTAVAQTIPAAYSGSWVVSGTDAGCFDINTNTLAYTVSTVVPPAVNHPASPFYNTPYPVTIQVPHLSQDLTVTVTAVDANQLAYPAVFSASTFTFSKTVTSQTLTVTLPVFASAVTLKFALSGPASTYVAAINPITFSPALIKVVVPNFGTQVPLFYTNSVSAPLTVALPIAPLHGLGIKISSASNTLTFSSPVLSFTPTGPTTQTFTFAQKLFSTADTIKYELTGVDANMYTVTVGSTDVEFQQIPIDNSVSTQVETVLNQPITFVLSTDVAPTDLQIVPAGPFTFSPAVIALSATTSSVKVTATPVYVGSSSPITFSLVGADAPNYATPSDISVDVLQGSVIVTGTSVKVNPNGQSTWLTVETNVIPPTGLTVTMYSASATFSPASVTLSPTTPKASFTFTLNNNVAYAPTSSLNIGFVLSGADAVKFNQLNELAMSYTYTSQYTLSADSSVSVKAGATSTVEIEVSGVTTSITVTPVSANSNLVFSPASYTFTPSTPTSTVIAISAQGHLLGMSSPIEWILSGADSALFANPDQTVVSYTKPAVTLTAFTPSSPVVGTQSYSAVTLDNAPVTGLTVTLSSPQAGVTITPSVLAFGASGATTQTYTVTSNSVQTVQILVALSGSNVADFAAPASTSVTFITGTILVTFPNTGTTFVAVGETRLVSFSLNTPAQSSLTITPKVDCLTFAPAITFAAGASYVEVQATALYYTAGQTITYVLSGADAARYAAPSTSTIVVSQLQLQTTFGDKLYNDVEVTVSVKSVTGALAAFDFGTLTVTPSAVGYTFTPASFTLSRSQLYVNLVASANTLLPTTTVVYTVSGSAAPVFDPAYLTASIPAFGRTNLVTRLSYTTGSVFVGQHVNGYVALSNALGTAHSTISTTAPQVTVTFSSNVKGIFEPSNVTLTSSATLAPFVFTPTQVYNAPVTVYYTVSGAGSTFFYTEGVVSQSPAISSVQKRTISVVSPQLVDNWDVLTFGNASDLFYVSTSAPYYTITVTPISPYFIFTPAEIHFGSGVASATFSATPVKLGYRATIYYQISGPDAALFATTTTTVITNIVPQISISELPILTPHTLSEEVTITLNPVPEDTYYITPSASGCTFNPPVLSFSPSTPSATFKIVSTEVSIYNPTSQGIVIPNNQYRSGYSGSSSQALNLQVLDAAGNNFGVPLTKEGYQVYINTAPKVFKLSHPRYQNDVTSHITVEVDELPRSDVSITFYGTNMEFDPPYVVFTHDGKYKQKVKVTPKHASSHDLDHDSFKIDYGCSGTDRDYYMCPTQTEHYVAIQRGYVAAAVLLPIAFIAACAVVGVLLYRRRQQTPAKKTSMELSQP